MPINISTIGATGTHSFARVNVDTDEDFIYFKGSGETIPDAFVPGTTFIYQPGVGTLGGLAGGALVYVTTTNQKKLTFSASSGGAAVDFSGTTAGGISFNLPVLFDQKLNIDASTADKQAVKYYTNETPITGLASGSTYFLKNVSISSFAGTQALYSFTNHTFNTAGLTGRVGPTIAQLRSSYTGATAWSTTFLSQGTWQGYQDWTVPVSGVYEFNVSGAAGWDGTGAGTTGRGAVVRGRIPLTKGEIITIIAGQRGATPNSGTVAGGSGGGSFVVRKTGNEPLFIAGGGSGEPNTGVGQDGALTFLGGLSQTNQIANFSAGQGGLASGGWSAGGGGFFSNGTDGFTFTNGRGSLNSQAGGNFFNGLTMTANSRNGGAGGFGGGSQADGNIANQSGGGGGYSGGAGARINQSNRGGGGGGSFLVSTATNVGTSNGSFEGINTFNSASVTNLNSWNTGEGSVGVTLVSSFTTGNEVYPTALDAENGTNKIAVASAGSSFHSFVPITLDLQNNQIHSTQPHTLTNGTAVTFSFGNTPPGNLQSNAVYYAQFVDTFTYSLSSTPGPSFSTINFTTPSKRSLGTSDAIRRIVVNTSTDTLTINNHGFEVDQPVQYTPGDGTSINPLQDSATYYISEVVDANRIKLKVALNAPTPIDFVSAGTGTSHSFIFVTVNLLENTLYLPNHSLISGQSVRYENGGGTTIAGLASGSTYFVVRENASIIKLASNKALTNIVDLTDVGTGTQSLVILSIDFATNTITLPQHGYLTKELVEYDSKGQQVIGGLTTATPYYVISLDGDNIKLATSVQNALEGIAIDLVDSPAGVGIHSLKSLTQTPDGIYDITSVPTPTTFTVAAKGRVSSIEKIFNPRSALDLNLDSIKLPSHGFVTGTRVTYNAGGTGTTITGLTSGVAYFVVVLNRDYLKLATNADNASAGITLGLDDFGTGVEHTFTTAQINGNITGGGNVSVQAGSVLVNGEGTSFSKILKVGDRFRLFPANVENKITFAAADVNATTNVINKTHTYETGDTVVFNANGGVAPTPLIEGYYYFVRNISETQLSLHGSFDDAVANTGLVDFSSQGTGTAFTLTWTLPVSPIIRRITAVGSDTQVTVDRPYANAFTDASYSFPTFLYVRPQGYSLHRPFDGGVEMSAGAETSLAQIVRQTRKYFRYQSGKGIQTSAGINFKPSIDLESMIQISPITIEAKTRRPHGLGPGLFVVISQATDSTGQASSVFNGRFQVTVVDLTTFRITASETIVENRAYGFPQFFVESWSNGAVRSGMFDFQNGAFYEYDGEKLYAVRRSSTQQIAGTAACLQGSELVFGTNTQFTAQLVVGDYIVMRGQSYRIVEIQSDTRLAIRPEYKGSSGIEKEFNPGNGTTGVVRLATDIFQITGHGFADNLPVVYNAIDGEQIGGLINGRTYYIELTDNNSFQLKAGPSSASVVSLSSVGTTSVHSFTPAKAGIIITKTVDTRVAQEDFNIDPLDGTGVTGYNLDLSRIQMVYMDYSWYGAGKIRFGFKTTDGQVQYTHEFIHNNQLYESYFRSGNLPARYEVVTYDNPTYIPFLFHWGTSVMMDGGFDDDNAYKFTSTSQALQVTGTTEKSFSSSALDVATNLITIPSHGFANGDTLQFEGIATSGLRGQETQNPALSVSVTAYNPDNNLDNAAVYTAFAASANTLGLFAPTSGIGAATGVTVSTVAQSTTVATIVTSGVHNLTSGQTVRLTGITQLGSVKEVYGNATVTNTTTFTMVVPTTATISALSDPGARVYRALDFTTQGNSQYTYFLYPEGALNNTSGPNYQPLISIRLSPSVSSGLTGKLGDRDVLNRMQLRLQEIGISSTQLVDVKVLLNGRLNNLNFQGVDSPSLTQVVEHTAADTVSGGVQVYNFRASGGTAGAELSTTVDVSSLFELSNSILGGDSVFPDGPDILTIAVSRLTGSGTLTSAKMSWSEAQA
jgi:hypothetical protein